MGTNAKRWGFIYFLVTAILTVLLFITFTGCGMLAVNKGEREVTTTEATTTDATQTINTNKFDLSTISREQQEYKWEPVDPSKAMEIRNDGEVISSTNARKVYKKSNEQQNNNISEEKEEENAESTTTEVDINETESWFKKFKISVPWYFYFFLFLFLILGLGIFLLFRKLSTALTIVKELKG